MRPFYDTSLGWSVLWRCVPYLTRSCSMCPDPLGHTDLCKVRIVQGTRRPRDASCKRHIVQGMEHPRLFVGFYLRQNNNIIPSTLHSIQSVSHFRFFTVGRPIFVSQSSFLSELQRFPRCTHSSWIVEQAWGFPIRLHIQQSKLFHFSHSTYLHTPVNKRRNCHWS
jgi:hypothetical protein